MIQDMAKKDWMAEVIGEIALMKGKEFTEFTDNGIRKIFSECGEKVSRIVAKRFRALTMIPNNIIGAIKKEVSVIELEEREKVSWKEHHVDDIGTSGEFKEIVAFYHELMEWHRLRFVQSRPDGLTLPMNIEEYIKAGRPETWSPILDDWMKGFERAYYEDRVTSGKLLDFLMRYNHKLKTQREKRLEQIENKKPQEKAA